MISSTARDLPAYRDQVKEACLRAEMLPKMMEHLPASDADAIEVSLELVDKADIYVGLFAHRYGYVPDGYDISITQMEYERAVERGIPRLIFLIGDKVPVLPEDFDLGESALKLKALKGRLKKERVVGFFKNPDHLHSQVLQSLNRVREQFKEKIETEPVAVSAEATSTSEPANVLPPLPSDIELPASPYRRLEYFERKDARVFFGRSKEILELHEALTEPGSAPIILFHGESGVGKSSLLAAGVLPRLESDHVVRYLRRDQSLGLSGTLAFALETDTNSIKEGWHSIEKREKKPLIVILDQVEELYTRPLDDGMKDGKPLELTRFLEVLDTLFANREARPAGRFVLAFRKEWLADIVKDMEEAPLPFRRMFLQRLSMKGIIEVAQGPQSTDRLRKRYGLSVEAGLPEMIASNLLKDLGSPVGPTLSILLHEMWERIKNEEHPAFTKALYREYEAKGLGDYLDEQIAALRAWNEGIVDSGLALDVLNYHTTDIGTAAARSLPALYARYPDRKALLDTLLEQSQQKYLLVSGQQKGKQAESVTRLAHDTLAPLVRQRHKDSNAPGQRAERVLQSRISGWKEGTKGPPLDEAGLAEVEEGKGGMRAWTQAEYRLVSESRRLRRQRRVQQYALLGLAAIVLGVLGWGYMFMNRYNECNTAGTQYEWCRACIDHKGEWGGDGDDVSRYCQGAMFDLPDVARDFVDIPAGTFTMGTDTSNTSRYYIGEDEYPPHEVRISQGFKMGKTEVTQAQWYAVMKENPSYRKGVDLPVEQVSWNGVQDFLDSLNALDSTYTYRLPTEAEWEYACRAGHEGYYGFDETTGSLDDYAWYGTNSGGGTRPVGTREPNAFGLYDMSGNVLEWVADYYGPYDSTSMVDPTGPESGDHRVLRGGSFVNSYYSVRCAYRNWYVPPYPDNLRGFRLVALPPSD